MKNNHLIFTLALSLVTVVVLGMEVIKIEDELQKTAEKLNTCRGNFRICRLLLDRGCQK